MKKLFISALFALSSGFSFGAGAIDGIYSCGVNMLGSSYSSYVTINGHSDGSAIYAVAAISSNQPFFGYGIGTATTTSFTGTTNFGNPFNFSVDPTTSRVTGTVGVQWNGATVNATTSCAKIW